MFTLDVSGINNLILKLEKRSEDYQLAVDSAVELAYETIKNRVKLGQLTDGSYRVSNSSPLNGRYSKSWGDKRARSGKSVKTHNLSFTGALHSNFVINERKSISKNNIKYSRSIGFTNEKVQGRDITYAQLAKIQESKTGVGFQLSPSQLVRVMARFKQVARL